MADIHTWRQGSHGVLGNRYFVAGMTNTVGGNDFVVLPNRLYAMPYIAGAMARQVDQLACFVTATTSAAGGRAQLGIYTVNCAALFYPQSLMLSGSDCDVSATGLKTIAIICSFRPDTLYWFAILSNVAVTLERMKDPFAIFGVDASTAVYPRPFITLSCAYGLLPNPFPSDTATTTSSFGTPAVGVRYLT